MIPCGRRFPAGRHECQSVLGRELNENGPLRVEKRLDDYRLRARLGHGGEGAFKFIGGAYQYRLKPEAGSCCGPSGGSPRMAR